MSRSISGGSSSSPGSVARRTPHDDLADDEDGFVMGMAEGDDVVYRRAEVAQQHLTPGAADGAHLLYTMPKDIPSWRSLAYESSGETVSFVGNPVKQRHLAIESHGHGSDIILGHSHGRGAPAHTSNSISRGPPLSDQTEDDIFEARQPEFWEPFRDGVGDEDAPEVTSLDRPRICRLPSTFRLERTNFTVRGDGDERPQVEELLGVLQDALEAAGIDVLEFRNVDSVFDCSFHRGNRFLSLWVRVYLPPGDEFDDFYGDNQTKDDDGSSYLIEAQLREGDRLHFSALFREVMKTFKSDNNGMSIGGTYRYHQKARPGLGEELVLEEVSFAPSRQSLRLMAEQQQEILSAAHPAAMRRVLADGIAGGGGPARGDVLGSAPPLPPGMMEDLAEELDQDSAEDIFTLANMLRGNYLDVQADAAMAVAGLTAEERFLKSLSQPGAKEAASALCSASARLLVETHYRPARRQAAVIVANLSTAPFLRAALLHSDACPGYVAGDVRSVSSARGLIQCLVSLAMGVDDFSEVSLKTEEEIGTRRECMRALVSFADEGSCQNNPAMLSVRAVVATGRAKRDAIFQSRLRQCRDLLAQQPEAK